MLATDAKKAGTASAETRRTPRPPSLTGRVTGRVIIIIISPALLHHC